MRPSSTVVSRVNVFASHARRAGDAAPRTSTAQSSCGANGVLWCRLKRAMNSKEKARSIVLLGLPLACGAGMLACRVGTLTERRTEARVVPLATQGPFFVRSYLGRCLTYGQSVINPFPGREGAGSTAAMAPAAPVFLDSCESGSSGPPGPFQQGFQRVIVEEINDRHEVMLRAGARYLGVPSDFEGAPVQLQTRTAGREQVFALDGDSIMLAADRGLVLKARGAKGASGTPVVLGRRNLDDSEFWDFRAVDGSERPPTHGFVSVSNAQELVAVLSNIAHFGTVIRVMGDINLRMLGNLTIPSGVTIRGNRRGLANGPELSAQCPNNGDCETVPTDELTTGGEHVRITGLRITGHSRSKDKTTLHTGILLAGSGPMIIDHNKLSNWTSAAIGVGLKDAPANWACAPPGTTFRPENVRIVRNFIHHNVRESFGYGVVVGGDGYAGIMGNTFLMNRHAIAADGQARTSYSAWFNLVMSNVPSYGTTRREQADFDMHGSDGSSHHTGGIGGGAVEIARNTFLGTDGRINFDLRGMACQENRFVNNVSTQDKGDALRWYVPAMIFANDEDKRHCDAELTTKDTRVEHRVFCGSQVQPDRTPPVWLTVSGNKFDATNPTNRLAVGDFDGDGRDDLFLATGQAWYFSPAGIVEWRYLSAQTERVDAVKFGDFDGDRRTDVLVWRAGDIDVSWGGLSRLERINQGAHPIADYAIGDFDGDGKADIFYANGTQWFVSSGGVSGFVPYAPFPQRVSALRFGDFDRDRKTDVFGVVSGRWQVVFAGTGIWRSLGTALTDSVTRLVVADFDGDRRADVATSLPLGNRAWRWVMSKGGTRPFAPVHLDNIPIFLAVGVGAFDETTGADVVTWGHGNRLAWDLVSIPRDETRRWSTQEMR